MHGLAELRVKESDRLAAIIAGLRALRRSRLGTRATRLWSRAARPPAGGATSPPMATTASR